MPIRMGLASSHAPSLFFSTYDGWQRMHHRLNDGHPQPHETELETAEVIAERVPRIKANFARLKEELTKFNPDVIIAVIGDQREWFDGSNIPNVAVYVGPDVDTVHNTGLMDVDPAPSPYDEQFRYPVKVDQELSKAILNGLVKDGFDAAIVTEMNPQSQPQKGVPHGWGNTGLYLLPDMNIPVVLVFVNVDDGPPAILNGERCLELGRAIARICESSSKRIAIYGSGGMSHDPRGPRSGWVDEPLDNWFLDQLSSGQADNLKAMFSFRSENFVGGTGELRCWTVVAGAVDEVKPGHKAEWTDYFPARKVTTGSGWVYWPPIEEQAPIAAG
jgi:hypothetical protein